MKKYFLLIIMTLVVAATGTLQIGCTASQKLNEKTGVQLWGENCGRCHNAPGRGEFRSDNWDVIGQHMRARANLTGKDTDKILAFLKGL